MSKNNEQRNLDLVDLFKEAYATLETTKKDQYKQTQGLWKCVKNDLNLKEKKMHELKLKAAQFKCPIMSFWESHCYHHYQRKKGNTPPITCSCQTSSESMSGQIKETEFIKLGMFRW